MELREAISTREEIAGELSAATGVLRAAEPQSWKNICRNKLVTHVSKDPLGIEKHQNCMKERDVKE